MLCGCLSLGWCGIASATFSVRASCGVSCRVFSQRGIRSQFVQPHTASLPGHKSSAVLLRLAVQSGNPEVDRVYPEFRTDDYVEDLHLSPKRCMTQRGGWSPSIYFSSVREARPGCVCTEVLRLDANRVRNVLSHLISLLAAAVCVQLTV